MALNKNSFSHINNRSQYTREKKLRVENETVKCMPYVDYDLSFLSWISDTWATAAMVNTLVFYSAIWIRRMLYSFQVLTLLSLPFVAGRLQILTPSRCRQTLDFSVAHRVLDIQAMTMITARATLTQVQNILYWLKSINIQGRKMWYQEHNHHIQLSLHFADRLRENCRSVMDVASPRLFSMVRRELH